MVRPPNYKQNKKRREDAKKKRQEEAQQRKAARKLAQSTPEGGDPATAGSTPDSP